MRALPPLDRDLHAHVDTSIDLIAYEAQPGHGHDGRSPSERRWRGQIDGQSSRKVVTQPPEPVPTRSGHRKLSLVRNQEGKCAIARARGHSLAAAVVAPILVMAAAPTPSAAETVLGPDAVENVVRMAVTDHFQRTVKRKTVESACYFDPQVEKTMRCSASWAGRNSGADRFYMRRELKSKVRSYCKEAGGGKCIVFMRNGELEYDGLSSEQSEKFASVLGNIPSYDTEAKPLPDGVDVPERFSDWFPGAKDHFDGAHRKRKLKNHHFAICMNTAGMASWSAAEGGGADISQVRSTCALRCIALSEMNSEEGDCYVVYEDGKFASASAEAALSQ